MGTAQTSIDSLVGPPVIVFPAAAYATGTYNPSSSFATKVFYSNAVTTPPNGTIANYANYRGVIMEISISRPIGAATNSVSVIPHHGPCPSFVTHDPFGAGWGFHVNGKDHASPGTSAIHHVFIDTQKSMPYLSAELTVNVTVGTYPNNSAIVSVICIPVIPKHGSRVSDFNANNLLKVYESGNLVAPYDTL